MEKKRQKKTAEAPRKKWSEMTAEEKRSALPKRLNKLGEWLLTEEAARGRIEVVDMKAVMR